MVTIDPSLVDFKWDVIDAAPLESIEDIFKAYRPDMDTAEYWRGQYMRLNERFFKLATKYNIIKDAYEEYTHQSEIHKAEGKCARCNPLKYK